MKRELDSKLCGNEVYYTACFSLVILKYSCSQVHCQKGFDLIIVSYKIWGLEVIFAEQFPDALQTIQVDLPGHVNSTKPTQ
jgi:hypothetical protein